MQANQSITEPNIGLSGRTAAQHLWAQIFELTADLVGRQIRYGGIPSDPDKVLALGWTTTELVECLLAWSELLAEDEALELELFELTTVTPVEEEFKGLRIRRVRNKGLITRATQELQVVLKSIDNYT